MEPSQEILDKSKTKQNKNLAWQTVNSASQCLMSKCYSNLHLLSVLFIVTQSYLLDWFHSLCFSYLAGIQWIWHLQRFGVSKTIQASLSQFHTIASLGLHAGKVFDTDLVTETFLSQKGIFINLFLLSLLLKTEPHVQRYQFLLLAGAAAWPNHSIISSLSLLFLFPSLPKLNCSGTPSVDYANYELRYLHAFVS